MTRSDVAKALKRSIATVRRMEGKELHPTVDWNGVHRFDPEEVEALAEGLAGRGGREAHFVSEVPDFLFEAQLRSLQAENDRLNGELREAHQVDDLAAKFMILARDATQTAVENDCPGAEYLRLRFNRLVQQIPT